MREYFRKAALLLLSALLMLTGCNGINGMDDVKGIESIKQEDLIDTQPKSIRFAFRYMRGGPSITKEVFREIELVTSSSWRFKLEYTQYSSKLDVISRGFWVPSRYLVERQVIESGNYDAVETQDLFYYLASNGLIMDLTNLFPQYAPNYFKMLSESDLESVTYNGRIMGIPAHWPGRSRYCVVARKSLVDKYNIKSLSNFKELEDFLRIVKKNEPGFVPIYHPGPDKTFYEIAGYVSPKDTTMIVYKVDDPEMKLIPWEETPEFVETMNMLKRWREEGYIVQLSGEYATEIENYACYIEKADHIGLYENSFGSGTDWYIFPLYPERPSVMTSDTDKILVIPKDSPNAINVLRFVEWVHSDQANYDMFMYGIEGRNYTVDEKSGKLRRITWPEYEGGMCFTNIKYMREFDTNPENLLEFYSEVSKLEEIPCPHAGFHMEEDLLPSEVWSKRMHLNKAMVESYYNVGIDEYRQQLRDAGTYELVRIMQQELDKWRKAREG